MIFPGKSSGIGDFSLALPENNLETRISHQNRGKNIRNPGKSSGKPDSRLAALESIMGIADS
jgi:hypothetical protein